MEAASTGQDVERTYSWITTKLLQLYTDVAASTSGRRDTPIQITNNKWKALVCCKMQ
jgi:hypothetical protein